MKKIFFILASLTVCNFVTAEHQIVNKTYQEDASLYPVTASYEEGYLKVSDLHSIYYAQFGNPHGIPVVTIHGGPGCSCFESWTSFFDPSVYRVIMFDQRGAGRSIPSAEMQENSPHYAVKDIEQLRKFLGVDKWIVFGGSYGSTLAVLYGETHPESTLGFVLRGITMSTKEEYEHLFYGMRSTYPEAWEDMVSIFSAEERENLIDSFEKRIMDPDPTIHLPAARAFMYFDTICAKLCIDENALKQVLVDDTQTLSVARAFIHYSSHQFFLKENQLLQDLYKIKHLPAILIHGRYDIICKPQSAYNLYVEWENAELWFIPTAGHSASEISTKYALKEAVDSIRNYIKN